MPKASEYWKSPETRLRLIQKASEWNKSNPEKRRQITRKSYKKNRIAANKASNNWQKANPIKVKEWNYKKYGLTYKTYLELFEKQNGVCALCGRPPSEKLLVVDHDHKTNKVRGLLHRSCNAALGILGDSIEGIEIALSYLKRTS